MSGAEFIAVLSIGASVIAVVDACNKLRNRVKEFQDDETLRELAAQLRLFSNGIEILRQQHTGEDLDPLTQDALIEVLDCCEKQIKELDVLIASALPSQKNTGFVRVRAAMRNLRDNKRVREILNSLQRCQQLLVFHMASVSKRRHQHQAQDQQGAYGIISAHEPSPGSCLDDVKKARPRRWPRPIPAQSCVRGTCGCACHRMTMRLFGVVSFNFPFPFLSECTCVDTTIGVSFFALHKILTFNISVSWMDGISMGTSLKFANTVPYSSPGMAVLAKFSAAAIGSAETIEALSNLRRNNLLDFDEATMNNEGYLERVLEFSWDCPEKIESTLDVLKYLTEQGAQWRSSKPISLCLQTVGVCGRIQSSVTNFFASLPPFELSGGHLSDFRFLKCMNNKYNYMPICLRVACEVSKCDNIYGGTTDLQDTIITGSLDEVIALMERKPELHHGKKDVFGHSALHFAIEKPDILAYLLRKGFGAEIDAKDCVEMTPLMYAAASKQLTSAKLLMDHGADPWDTHEIYGTHRDSFFWADLYSRTYRDSSAFIEFLDYYLGSVSQRQAQVTVDHCLERLINTSEYISGEEEDRAETEILMHLLQLGADLNQVQPNGNTFLHSIRDSERAEFLLTLPINVLNHQNARGMTALMIWVRFDNAHLIHALLHAGADAKIKDDCNRSALHHSLEEMIRVTYWASRYYHYCLWGRSRYSLFNPYSLSSFTWQSYGPECINAIASCVALTRAGASLLEGDSCTCYCSMGGCTPLHKFFQTMETGGAKRDMLLFQLPWLLELSLAMEACGVNGVLDDAVRILVRQRLFERLKMTHTCCNERMCSRDYGCNHEFSYQHGLCVAMLPIGRPEVTETQRGEAELNKQLVANVEDSGVPSGHLNESQLIGQLANWAAELEERPIAYMDTSPSRLYRKDKKKVENRKRQMTQISSDPAVFVDNSSGEIISFREPDPLITWTASDFIKIYLDVMSNAPDYLADLIDTEIDSDSLASRRESLAKQLMEEIDRLRSR